MQYHLVFGRVQTPHSVLPTALGCTRPLFLLGQLREQRAEIGVLRDFFDVEA